MIPSSIVHRASEGQTHSSMVAWLVREFGSPNTDGCVSNRNQVTRKTVENPVEKVRVRRIFIKNEGAPILTPVP
jgi:hypothetical protein